MFSTSHSRLHSAALIDKEQYEETRRVSRTLNSAPAPVTPGFLGSDLFGKLFRRQSQDSEDSLLSQSRSQSRASRRGSQGMHLVSLLDREQVSSSRAGRTRSLSLVSSLDTTQTRGISHYRKERSDRPAELGELNTLQQAIPVARAAARFRSVISDSSDHSHMDRERYHSNDHSHMDRERYHSNDHSHMDRERYHSNDHSHMDRERYHSNDHSHMDRERYHRSDHSQEDRRRRRKSHSLY